jgi:hypothetical protein
LSLLLIGVVHSLGRNISMFIVTYIVYFQVAFMARVTKTAEIQEYQPETGTEGDQEQYQEP